MTQTLQEESLFFYNQGSDNFEENQVLEFHPGLSSSYIDLVDFNKEGFLWT
jgi:hypothetical protein